MNIELRTISAGEIGLARAGGASLPTNTSARLSVLGDPALLQHGQHVTLNVVRAVVLSRQQVTAPGVMPPAAEGFAHDAGELAANQNLHGLVSLGFPRVRGYLCLSLVL